MIIGWPYISGMVRRGESSCRAAVPHAAIPLVYFDLENRGNLDSSSLDLRFLVVGKISPKVGTTMQCRH